MMRIQQFPEDGKERIKEKISTGNIGAIEELLHDLLKKTGGQIE